MLQPNGDPEHGDVPVGGSRWLYPSRKQGGNRSTLTASGWNPDCPLTASAPEVRPCQEDGRFTGAKDGKAFVVPHITVNAVTGRVIVVANRRRTESVSEST